jgi:hypothetical protein
MIARPEGSIMWSGRNATNVAPDHAMAVTPAFS